MIAKSIEKYGFVIQEISTLNLFLNTAIPIPEAGWESEENESSQWPFSYIIEFIGLSDEMASDALAVGYVSEMNDKYTQSVSLVAMAIQYQFSKKNFQTYLTITNEMGRDFQDMKCKKKILYDIFCVDKNDINPELQKKNYEVKGEVREINYGFWEKNDKKIFLDHLRLIFDIYRSDETQVS